MGFAARFLFSPSGAVWLSRVDMGNAWGGIQAESAPPHIAVGDRCQCNAAERSRGVAVGIGVAAVCGVRREKAGGVRSPGVA